MYRGLCARVLEDRDLESRPPSLTRSGPDIYVDPPHPPESNASGVDRGSVSRPSSVHRNGQRHTVIKDEEWEVLTGVIPEERTSAQEEREVKTVDERVPGTGRRYPNGEGE